MDSILAELSEDLNPNLTRTSQPSMSAPVQLRQTLSPELIHRCAEDFKVAYRTTLCRIRADPFNPDSLVQFEDKYTHLVLKDEFGYRYEYGPDETVLEYRDLPHLFPRRLLVQGEAGAGKTTFCAKIAWDWINGKYFQEYVWVIIVPLQEYEQRTIGEIAKSYLPEDNPATAAQLTEYMRSNTNKVFIVLDGFDKFKRMVAQPEVDESAELQLQATSSTDSSKHRSKQGSTDGPSKKEGTSSGDKGIEIIEILQSEELRDCPVIVTTRPFMMMNNINWNNQDNKYRFLSLQGFSKENLAVYVRKYFAGDEAKADDLIHFADDNDAISENMAPYPIYIAMLCLMWRETDEEKREMMKSLQTISQIFRELILFLKEHYAQKLVIQFGSVDDSLDDRLEEIDNLLTPIASLAFDGSLKDTLVFTEAEFDHCKQSMQTACRVGVLSQENSIIMRERRRNRSNRSLASTIFFPHKLFREFMASKHLASLYETDNHEYNRLMTEVVVPHMYRFQYLLYFASSENQAVGIDVITRTLECGHEDFLVDVAFECHTPHAATLVKDKVLPRNARRSSFSILHSRTAHTVAGYAFLGLDMRRLKVTCRPTWMRASCGPTMSHYVAEMMCSSPSLRKVKIESEVLHKNFCNRLAARGQFSTVKYLELSNCQVSAPASTDLAAGLCAMPQLTKLSMAQVPIHGFCAILRARASSMKVQSLHFSTCGDSDPAASADLAASLCSMPHLTEMSMPLPLHDEFYSTLKTMASSMKVESLEFRYNDTHFSAPASADLAAGLCAMPHLTQLKMNCVPLHDEFCSALTENAASMKVQSLNLSTNRYLVASAPASAYLATGLCAMPHLTELTLNFMPLHDEFCSTWRARASSMKLKSLAMHNVLISEQASNDFAAALGSLPHLTDLSVTDGNSCGTISALGVMASTMEGCLPQISKGNFKFNGEPQTSLESFISALNPGTMWQ